MIKKEILRRFALAIGLAGLTSGFAGLANAAPAVIDNKQAMNKRKLFIGVTPKFGGRY